MQGPLSAPSRPSVTAKMHLSRAKVGEEFTVGHKSSRSRPASLKSRPESANMFFIDAKCIHY